MVGGMTLAQLKAVFEVMAAGSISLAARKLYLTQPAVTKQIRALEEELQVRLFERSGKRLLPTTAAHELLPRIGKLIRGMEGLKNAHPSRGEAEVNGVVCIGCGSVFSQTIIPSTIAACRKRHPKMQVVIFESSIREQIQRMRKGEFRIALGSDYVKDSALRFTSLLEDELVLIVPHDHRLAKGKKRVPLSEVAQQESLITHYYAGGMEAALRQAGVPRRLLMNDNPVGARTTNTGTIIAFVACGLGVSIVPRYMVKLLNPPNLAIRELDPPLPIRYGCYQQRDISLNPAESAFLEVLQSVLAEWQSGS